MSFMDLDAKQPTAPNKVFFKEIAMTPLLIKLNLFIIVEPDIAVTASFRCMCVRRAPVRPTLSGR